MCSLASLAAGLGAGIPLYLKGDKMMKTGEKRRKAKNNWENFCSFDLFPDLHFYGNSDLVIIFLTVHIVKS